MKVKVCGMKHNAEEIARLGPDYLGFIFWPGSPRYFEGAFPSLPKMQGKVGVFVDASLEEILAKIQNFQLNLVQLHGSESPAFCRRLQNALGNVKVAIIKVFSVKDSFDFNELTPFEDVCDFYLFDTWGKRPGGNGYGFDWHLLAGYPSLKPYFLSGGIGLEDLQELQEFFKRPEALLCHAVDVNSRFETEPGMKKTRELEEFINIVSARH